MKIRFIFLILLAINQSVIAEPNLIGEWISDRELSMEYAQKHIRMEKKTYRFLEEMLGRMRVSFTSSKNRSARLGKYFVR